MNWFVWAFWGLAALCAAGLAIEITALVKRAAVRWAVAGLALRVVGVLAIVGFVLAGRGRPDFQDLAYVVLGMMAAMALWGAAAVIDVVLIVLHLRARRADAV